MAASEPDSVRLSPLDNIMPRIHIPKLLIFPSNDPSATASSLRAGLEQLLNALPVLSGVITSMPESAHKGAQHIVGPWKSIEEIFSTKDLTDSDDWDYELLKKEKFPYKKFDPVTLLPISKMAGPSLDVLAIQANLVRNGVILTFCLHHGFADESGMATVASLWARACRGENVIGQVKSTMLDRSLLLRLKEESLQVKGRRPSIGDFPEFVHVRGGEKAPTNVDSQSEKLHTEILYFSHAKISSLKALASSASETEGSQEPAPQVISTNDVLSALLAVCTTHAKRQCRSAAHPSSSQPLSTAPSTVTLAVNNRERLATLLPSNYIPNTITFLRNDVPLLPSADSTLSASQALSSPTTLAFRRLTNAIRNNIDKVGSNELTRLMQALLDDPELDWSKVAFNQRSHQNSSRESTDEKEANPEKTSEVSEEAEGEILWWSTWAKQGYGQWDWGPNVGRVAKIRLCKGLWKDLAVVLPETGEEEEQEEGKEGGGSGGGLEVALGLEEDVFELLKQDEFLRRWVEWRGE